jgi:hypothetical protein
MEIGPGASQYIQVYQGFGFLCLRFKIVWDLVNPVWKESYSIFNLFVSFRLQMEGINIIDAESISYRNYFRMKYGFDLPNSKDTCEFYFKIPYDPSPNARYRSPGQMQIELNQSFGYMMEDFQYPGYQKIQLRMDQYE